MWILFTTGDPTPIRLYVQEIDNSAQNVIARLQPLYGYTIRQDFGRESPIIKVKAKVVGNTAKDAVYTKFVNKAICVLSGYTHYYHDNLVIKSYNEQADEASYQTIDTTQDCYTPVYTLSLELYKDESL